MTAETHAERCERFVQDATAFRAAVNGSPRGSLAAAGPSKQRVNAMLAAFTLAWWTPTPPPVDVTPLAEALYAIAREVGR